MTISSLSAITTWATPPESNRESMRRPARTRTIRAVWFMFSNGQISSRDPGERRRDGIPELYSHARGGLLDGIGCSRADRSGKHDGHSSRSRRRLAPYLRMWTGISIRRSGSILPRSHRRKLLAAAPLESESAYRPDGCWCSRPDSSRRGFRRPGFGPLPPGIPQCPAAVGRWASPLAHYWRSCQKRRADDVESPEYGLLGRRHIQLAPLRLPELGQRRVSLGNPDGRRGLGGLVHCAHSLCSFRPSASKGKCVPRRQCGDGRHLVGVRHVLRGSPVPSPDGLIPMNPEMRGLQP